MPTKTPDTPTVSREDDAGTVVVLRIHEKNLKHLREMVRQQYLGDREMLRDCIAGREDPELRLNLANRITWLRRLADRLGMPENLERRQGVDRTYVYGPVRRFLLQQLL